jgi:hypothetical protein
MRLQAFSPAPAFTSTALRTPPNNNNKVASVSAPSSSQRQGFDPEIFSPEKFKWLLENNPDRLPQIAEEIKFILKCFDTTWFKTFLKRREIVPTTRYFIAELGNSRNEFSKYLISGNILSNALSSFHLKLLTSEPTTFDHKVIRVYFQNLLQQVQE